ESPGSSSLPPRVPPLRVLADGVEVLQDLLSEQVNRGRVHRGRLLPLVRVFGDYRYGRGRGVCSSSRSSRSAAVFSVSASLVLSAISKITFALARWSSRRRSRSARRDADSASFFSFCDSIRRHRKTITPARTSTHTPRIPLSRNCSLMLCGGGGGGQTTSASVIIGHGARSF